VPVWLYEEKMAIRLGRYDVWCWFHAIRFSLPIAMSEINWHQLKASQLREKNCTLCAYFG
jgi:hypothetical protein